MGRLYTCCMQKLFNKIVVPVDFSAGSEAAVAKSVDIAGQYGCSVHLLHCVPVSQLAASGMPGALAVASLTLASYNKELEYRLKKMEGFARGLSSDDIKVTSSFAFGSWEHAMVDLIENEHFDLVVIPQRGKFSGKKKMIADPDHIASRTNVAVITVPANRRLTRLYSIVIPITDFLPVRKLMYGIYIASEYNTTVKLIGIGNDGTKNKVNHYLQMASRLIREHSDVNVVSDLIQAENVAEAVNHFAMSSSADLVIVNPVTQTKMPGLLSSIMGNTLQKNCAPPVLTVSPV